MKEIWIALAGVAATLLLEALALAVAWGRHSERLSDLEKQVNNDVLGRKAIAAHGQTLSAISARLEGIYERLDRLPCATQPAACRKAG
ncbi:MAG: hypothetical protein A2018_06835 [Alphaproteobacteria bacterium GWF2_58_20]|nr:MAG: hypothetical protein A2018_06835 [Alphaproteobacteria bacterium GWF2_58_20]